MAIDPRKDRGTVSDPLYMPKTMLGIMKKQRYDAEQSGIGCGPIDPSPQPGGPSEPWFPAVDDWCEEFASKRKKTLLILGAVIGLIVGVAQHTTLIFTALCVPFGIGGMVLFIGLLRFIIKAVLIALMLALAGGIIFLVRAAYHYF